MKFFIDTANVDEIRAANDMGVIAGVTTNPSLIAKEGRDYAETLAEIASIVDGRLLVSEGPLKGQEARVSRVDRHRRRCLVTVSDRDGGFAETMPIDVPVKS